MKKSIFMIFCFCLCIQASAQIEYSNYIQHRIYLDNSGTKFQTELETYDGLGKIMQKISNTNSSVGIYESNLVEYDGLGRVDKEWLPVPTSISLDLCTTENVKSKVQVYYQDAKPYKKTSYDVLERTLSEILPGEDWYSKNKNISYFYGTNSTHEVRLFSAPLGSSKLEDCGYYPANKLFVETLTDEDGNVVSKYMDESKKVILERRNGSNYTYFVYNDKGELRYVLPQGYFDDSETDSYANFAYEYRYNGKGQCIWQKLPGCEPIQRWYDAFMRLSYWQDGNLRLAGQCKYFLYDTMGRLSEEGLCPSSYAGTGSVGRVNLLKRNYYDNYSFLKYLNSSSLSFQAKPGYPQSEGNAKGLLTGIECYHLDGSGDNELYAYYYDEKGNIIQIQSTNHLGGIESIYQSFSFTDNINKICHVHSEQGMSPIEEETFYTYDMHTDKLISVEHRINNNEIKKVLGLMYDETGLLVNKTIAQCENLAYSYNLRQWLQGIKGKNFSEEVSYNVSTDGKIIENPQYSGNISSLSWSTGDNTTIHRYDFRYDGLNRLISSSYKDQISSDSRKGFYDTSYSYDSMGNLLRLCRCRPDENKRVIKEDVSFFYCGNQLIKADDKFDVYREQGTFGFVDKVNSDEEYAYDANGNMTKDLNKGIEKIVYNVLNLPSHISFASGESIDFLYDSKGSLLRKKYYTSLANIVNSENKSIMQELENKIVKYKNYFGNIIYDGMKYNILFDGGFSSYQPDSIPFYHFFIQDHQGNVRVLINENSTIEQVSHYYPFGGLMQASSNDFQPYRYNCKELERMYGLDWYDYGARMYDGLRFMTPDRFMVKRPDLSPYSYCANNPMNSIDENGDSICVLLAPAGARGYGHLAILIQNENGKWELWSKNGTPNNYGFSGREGQPNEDSRNNRGTNKLDESISYNSIEDFFNSKENPKTNNVPEYTEGYMIPTSSDQDIKAQQAISQELRKKYNLIFSNCADAVNAALKAASLNSGSGFFPKKSVYPSIKKKNPQGRVQCFYNFSKNQYYKYK